MFFCIAGNIHGNWYLLRQPVPPDICSSLPWFKDPQISDLIIRKWLAQVISTIMVRGQSVSCPALYRNSMVFIVGHRLPSNQIFPKEAYSRYRHNNGHATRTDQYGLRGFLWQRRSGT